MLSTRTATLDNSARLAKLKNLWYNLSMDFHSLKEGAYLCSYTISGDSDEPPFVAYLKKSKAGFKLDVGDDGIDIIKPIACIEDFLKRGYKVIKRNGEYHTRDTLRVWSDEDFTVYPDRAGIPLYCRLAKPVKPR